MWQAPNQRMRGASKKRDRDRARPPFHIKRVYADVSLVSAAAAAASVPDAPALQSLPADPGAASDPVIAASPQPQALTPSDSFKMRLLLNDISPKGVCLSAPKALEVGQELTITITAPIMICLHARVVYSQEHYNESHVISTDAFDFRIGVKFCFANAAEEASVKSYCDELLKTILLAA